MTDVYIKEAIDAYLVLEKEEFLFCFVFSLRQLKNNLSNWM